MGTKNTPGLFDCYDAADPDEPLFVLLARDKHAPTLIWLWATLRELGGEDPAKVAEARQVCADMLTWAHKHDRPSVGLGQAALAAVLELIRGVNNAARKLGATPSNTATDLDVVRLFLSQAEFDPPPDKTDT